MAKYQDQPKRIFAHPKNPLLLGVALLEDAGLVHAADDKLSFDYCHLGSKLWLPDVVTHAIAAVTIVLTLIAFVSK
jgi:hypothetical protein